MKKLSVTISLEMEVPEDWQIHRSVEGVDVLKVGDGRFLDLTFEPMLADDPEGTWTDSADDAFLEALLDMVVSEDVVYRLETED